MEINHRICQLYQKKALTQVFFCVHLFYRIPPAEFTQHSTPCHLLDPEAHEKGFPFKEEFETFKVQTIIKIKNLILKEIAFLKNFRKSSNGGISSRTASFHE